MVGRFQPLSSYLTFFDSFPLSPMTVCWSFVMHPWHLFQKSNPFSHAYFYAHRRLLQSVCVCVCVCVCACVLCVCVCLCVSTYCSLEFFAEWAQFSFLHLPRSLQLHLPGEYWSPPYLSSSQQLSAQPGTCQGSQTSTKVCVCVVVGDKPGSMM